jgi:type I restriction enzyme, S subunit
VSHARFASGPIKRIAAVARFGATELDSLSLMAGDVVVAEGGADYGRSAWLSAPLQGWGFQTSIIRLRARAQLGDGRFLNYALQASLASGEIAIACNSSTVARFTAEKVARHPVPQPSVEEQRAVADFLDRKTAQIDAFIADQEELIVLLGERRSAALGRSLDWVWQLPKVPLKRLFSPRRIRADASREDLLVHHDHGVASKASLADNFEKVEDISRYREVRPGDLAINRMKAWQGALGVSELHGMVSGDHEVVAPSGGSFVPKFAHALLRSPRLVAEYRTRSTGIQPSQWRLNWEQMGEIRVPVPPTPEQHAIVEHLDRETSEIDSVIADAAEAIALSKERRSAMIAAAVTGRIDVSSERAS